MASGINIMATFELSPTCMFSVGRGWSSVGDKNKSDDLEILHCHGYREDITDDIVNKGNKNIRNFFVQHPELGGMEIPVLSEESFKEFSDELYEKIVHYTKLGAERQLYFGNSRGSVLKHAIEWCTGRYSDEWHEYVAKKVSAKYKSLNAMPEW